MLHVLIFIKVLGCTNVGENVAYNYTTPKSVLNAWLLSVT
jgi:uncharacterized protein YkwD